MRLGREDKGRRHGLGEGEREGERGVLFARPTYLEFAGPVQRELCLLGLERCGVTDNHAVAAVAV